MKARAAALRQAGRPPDVTECRRRDRPRRHPGSRPAPGRRPPGGPGRPRAAPEPRISLGLEGHTKLTGLITKKYPLDEINQGYQDLMDGRNIRGVVAHQH
jgi:alcohol dehydrogenase (nicotinoprotein)